jgi:hypothetical protein
MNYIVGNWYPQYMICKFMFHLRYSTWLEYSLGLVFEIYFIKIS